MPVPDDYETIWDNTIGSKKLPQTPAKGNAMPQTLPYWEKRAMMDQELILEQKEEISKLKQKVNQLEQKR